MENQEKSQAIFEFLEFIRGHEKLSFFEIYEKFREYSLGELEIETSDIVKEWGLAESIEMGLDIHSEKGKEILIQNGFSISSSE
jgi:hypothetical protein